MNDFYAWERGYPREGGYTREMLEIIELGFSWSLPLPRDDVYRFLSGPPPFPFNEPDPNLPIFGERDDPTPDDDPEATERARDRIWRGSPPESGVTRDGRRIQRGDGRRFVWNPGDYEITRDKPREVTLTCSDCGESYVVRDGPRGTRPRCPECRGKACLPDVS
jgi:hypothetical protein